MGCELAGTPGQPTCFPTMIHANANDGSRISCRAAPAMPPLSASSVLNCSLFGLIWTPDTLGWNYFAGFSDLAFITAQSKTGLSLQQTLGRADRQGVINAVTVHVDFKFPITRTYRAVTLTKRS